MLGYILEALQIQEELVRAKKLIPDTEAGQHLQYSLNHDQLLKTLDNKKRTTTSIDPAQIWTVKSQRRFTGFSQFATLDFRNMCSSDFPVSGRIVV